MPSTISLRLPPGFLETTRNDVQQSNLFEDRRLVDGVEKPAANDRGDIVLLGWDLERGCDLFAVALDDDGHLAFPETD